MLEYAEVCMFRKCNLSKGIVLPLELREMVDRQLCRVVGSMYCIARKNKAQKAGKSARLGFFAHIWLMPSSSKDVTWKIEAHVAWAVPIDGDLYDIGGHAVHSCTGDTGEQWLFPIHTIEKQLLFVGDYNRAPHKRAGFRVVPFEGNGAQVFEVYYSCMDSSDD